MIVFWVWGFSLENVLTGLSDHPYTNLNSFKFSETSLPIEGIVLDIRSVNLDLKPGHILICTYDGHYVINFDQPSQISIRLDEKPVTTEKLDSLIDAYKSYTKNSSKQGGIDDYIFIEKFQLISLNGNIQVSCLIDSEHNPEFE